MNGQPGSGACITDNVNETDRPPFKAGTTARKSSDIGSNTSFHALSQFFHLLEIAVPADKQHITVQQNCTTMSVLHMTVR
jgi:hypothetical protein